MDPVPLTWNEALSGIFGSISIASWIFVLVPQMAENYTQSHADGLSLSFIIIWMIGDIANFAGALWAHLVPTVIALGVYFCAADVVLLAQVVYYRMRGKRVMEGENEPLISGRESEGNGTERAVRMRAWVRNTLSIAAILVVGTAGWAVAWRTGAWKPSPAEDGEGGVPTPAGAEFLGYMSAVCYLGARIPQIIKNQRERSCEGLSLLFFMLSLLGNATYGAGILFHSVEKRYFITNLPWLIGSLGTMVEDVVIFAQFSAFGDHAREEVQ
ncbi:PQ-loop-domain-containing protein [Piedraia hortae CBS 480.64]|uniref:PQ-loop-domain-containing protein n=1 Tax=Piedraia hortae CBS 480.64 TaxID=1314780 RepID=A0A6A7BXU5_9PEZI|nr:PQ-loop-domain-containing protein [Piedraia hortae CBS 480.64]